MGDTQINGSSSSLNSTTEKALHEKEATLRAEFC